MRNYEEKGSCDKKLIRVFPISLSKSKSSTITWFTPYIITDIFLKVVATINLTNYILFDIYSWRSMRIDTQLEVVCDIYNCRW